MTYVLKVHHYDNTIDHDTYRELCSRMARDHVRAGLAVASFFCIVPFPGTKLFDETLASGALAPDWHPDTMNWTMASWTHSTVPAATINAIRRVAWECVNDPIFTTSRKAMVAA